MKPYLSVIIPAYNEESRIQHTLEAVYTYLQHQPYSWELLIVLDGGQDNTLGVVKQFAEGKKGLEILNRVENKGKGYTVRQGMLAAQGAIRLFTDADNSTSMAHFEKMQPLFEQGHQVVICSRDGKDHPSARQAVAQPFFKRLLGNLGNLFIQAVAVPGIWDTQCGYKAFTAEAAEQIFAVSRIDRWAFDIEALALARKFGYKIGVIGADWVDKAGTHVKMSDYITTFSEAVKIRWHLLKGVYDQPQPKPTAINN